MDCHHNGDTLSLIALEDTNMLTALLWIAVASILFSGFFAVTVVANSSRLSRTQEWEEPIRSEVNCGVRVSKTA